MTRPGITASGSAMKNVIEAGLTYGVLPLSACHREIDDGRLRFAPIEDATLTQRLI
ncbi:LysR substrate-binding domain-containing protein [Mycolicibacterium sp. XJ775]